VLAFRLKFHEVIFCYVGSLCFGSRIRENKGTVDLTGPKELTRQLFLICLRAGPPQSKIPEQRSYILAGSVFNYRLCNRSAAAIADGRGCIWKQHFREGTWLVSVASEKQLKPTCQPNGKCQFRGTFSV